MTARALTRFFCTALLSVLVACHATTTVILVRHAERPPGADPDINELGRARAESLSTKLLHTKVDAIIQTQFKRTQQTALPLATRTGIVPTTVPTGASADEHAKAVARLIDGQKGKTIVYVGHSNTVPLVLAQLGIAHPPAIADSEYFHFFTVRKKEKKASLIATKY